MIQTSLDRPIRAADLQPLLAQTDWANTRTSDQIDHMLRHSVNVGVWDDDRLVAYGRAVTDDLFRAFIEDVIVDQPYRGQGLGRAVVQALLDRLAHVQELTLFCIPENIPFYEKFAFQRRTQPCMFIVRGA